MAVVPQEREQPEVGGFIRQEPPRTRREAIQLNSCADERRSASLPGTRWDGITIKYSEDQPVKNTSIKSTICNETFYVG